MDKNSDKQGTDTEVGDNTEEENKEVNNGVNVEVNIDVPTESVEVNSDTDDTDTSDTQVVDNMDEDKEVKKNETSNA